MFPEYHRRGGAKTRDLSDLRGIAGRTAENHDFRAKMTLQDIPGTIAAIGYAPV